MSRSMGSYFDVEPFSIKTIKYEVITPLKPKDLKTIKEMLNRDDVYTIFAPSKINAPYRNALVDSNEKVLCFIEHADFSNYESYRICLGDYNSKTAKPREVANINCWYKEVHSYEKIKSARKRMSEKKILDTYELIEHKTKIK
ncbi:MAG: hypothetical protein IJL23_00285 [Alphaproteobacteria bacterium]|nr:hypothetical protein [Alphaproteobacteria bacterium]